jgi:hypothetical protein
MELKESLAQLAGSDAYKSWDRQDYYLVHFFSISGNPLQIGFYSKTTKKAVCFEMREVIARAPEADILREGDTLLEELDLDGISRQFDDAISTGRKLVQQKFPHESPVKEIVMLQSMGGLPQYSITFLTKSQHLINCRIDAIDGTVRSYEIHSLMDFARPLDKE